MYWVGIGIAFFRVSLPMIEEPSRKVIDPDSLQRWTAFCDTIPPPTEVYNIGCPKDYLNFSLAYLCCLPSCFKNICKSVQPC